MNKALDKTLSSPEFTSSFAEIFFTNKRITMANILKRSYLNKQKRPNAQRVDEFLTMQPASRSIPEALQPFIDVVQTQYNTKKGSKGVPLFLDYFREKLREDFCNARFAKSDNKNVLSNNINFDQGSLILFRSKLLKTAKESVVDNIADEQLKSRYVASLEAFSSYLSTCDDLTIKDLRDKFTVFSDSFYKRLNIDTATGTIDKPAFDAILTRMFIEQQLSAPESTTIVGNNLSYSRIRRDVNLGFDQRVFQGLIQVENLIASYQLGLINDEHEIVFNGECFIDRKTGKRVTETSQPISELNITSIGRSNQSSFVLPENMVYGMRGTKNFGNQLSYTTQHDNIYNGENFTGQNPPLYFNKNGFFGKKKAEYSVHSRSVNSRGKTIEYTHTLYSPVENDTGELYVKVAERVPDEGHVKFTLYAFPLNHVGAGVQICRVENNPEHAQRHTLKGSEKIYTNFHVHQYNLIDQMYILGGKEGHFDITYKLKDALTERQAEAIFNHLTNVPHSWSKKANNIATTVTSNLPPITTTRKITSFLKTPKIHYSSCILPPISQIFKPKQTQDPFKAAKAPISATDFANNWVNYSVNGFIKQKGTVCALTPKTPQQFNFPTPPITRFISSPVGTEFIEQSFNQITTATNSHSQTIVKEEMSPKLPIELPPESQTENALNTKEFAIIDTPTIMAQLTSAKFSNENFSIDIPPEQ